MHKAAKLEELLEEKLCEMGKHPDLTPQELDNVYKAAKTIYYMEVVKAMKGEEDIDMSYNYSGDMDYLRNRYRMNPNSYGSYGNSYRRGRNGRYSRDDARSEFIDKLEMMMHEAPTNSEKETIQRCINKMNAE